MNYNLAYVIFTGRPMNKTNRCPWCGTDPLYINYHDKEWGVPLYDDVKLFEFLILEGFQAGLSWLTILRKREIFRKAFDNFNPDKIARYNLHKINLLLNNKGIIRNRLKIYSAVKNARAYLNVTEKYGSFSDYMWQFTEGRIIKNKWNKLSQIPVRTSVSDAMSRKLREDGFRFAGSVICYAHMQATGMVNDHLISCFRHNEL